MANAPKFEYYGNSFESMDGTLRYKNAIRTVHQQCTHTVRYKVYGSAIFAAFFPCECTCVLLYDLVAQYLYNLWYNIEKLTSKEIRCRLSCRIARILYKQTNAERTNRVMYDRAIEGGSGGGGGAGDATGT